MKPSKDPLDQNPFNVPFVLGVMTKKLMEKLEEHPSKVFTETEVVVMIDEIVLQLCSSAEQELIKGKAIEFLISYLHLSKN